MNIRKNLLATVGATAILASTAMTGVAATDDDAATVEITSNTTDNYLTVVLTGDDFGQIPYSFTDTPINDGVLTVVVTDTRGTEDGWTVNLIAGDFIGPDDSFLSSQLALDPSGPAQGVTFQGATGNTAGQSYGVPFNAGASTFVWGASDGSGAGQYQLNIDADLTVPGGTLVGQYSSLITVDIAPSAP